MLYRDIYCDSINSISNIVNAHQLIFVNGTPVKPTIG